MALADHTKQARVAVILDAAERLIRADAGTQFSMRALALEAGVSQATPFNLLGSKAKILEALFVRSFALPQGEPREFNPSKHNALDYSFDMCELIARRYAADAAYYRALMSGLGTGFDSLRAGIANWQLVLAVAVQQGDLRPDTPVTTLAETVELGIVGTMAFWISGDLSAERLLPQWRFAIASTLSMFATPSAAPRLRKIVKSAARRLQALGPLAT
ncbi:MAG TPA: helix-turn-helix domain-containing protein [Polyangiales bacterium]|nr:helix-turn-helix domain-containing protein [Polyangiales bacterium]